MNSSPASQNGASRPATDARLREAWQAVRRNWKLSVGMAGFVLIATVGFLLLVTPVYQESTSLRIEDKKASIPLLPMDMLPQLGGGSEVETEMGVLRSRIIAEEVVDSLNLQVVLEAPRRALRSDVLSQLEADRSTLAGDYTLERQEDGRYVVEVSYEPEPKTRGGLFSRSRTVEETLGTFAIGQRIPLRGGVAVLGPGAAEHESIAFRVEEFYDAVEELRERVGVNRPAREANLVVVSAQGPDPELVRDVANAMAGTFITWREEASKSEERGTVGFLQDQIDALTVQLSDAEIALSDYRRENLVIAPEAEASAQMERLAKMQGERDLAAAEAVALGQLLQEIDAENATAAGDSSAYRRLIAFPTLFRNPAASELLGQLAEVENERAMLSNRRTAGDVDIQVLTARVRDIERQLRILAITYLQGLGKQVASLNATLGRYQGDLESIPDRQLEYGRRLRQAEIFNEIYVAMQGRLKEAELNAAINDVSVRVIDPAILPDEPVKPNVPLSLAFAVVLGAALGLGGALTRDALDTTVRTRNDLQEAGGLTVLGSIPRARTLPEEGRRRFSVRVRDVEVEPRLVSEQDPRGPIAEAYRALRTSITFTVPDGRPQMLVFTSATPGDGKSTTAGNLAITFAQQEARVLLVDANLRRGGLHQLFELRREPGLSDVIDGTATLADALQTVDGAGGGRIDFLATGTASSNPAALLGSARLKDLLKEWRARYDMVIMDAPPLNLVTDAAILGMHADGVVLVARSGATDRSAVTYALEQLRQVRAPVLGTVLNDLDVRTEAHAGSLAAYADHYGQGTE